MKQCACVLCVFAFAILVAACASPTPTPVPPTPTRMPPTATLVPPTATLVPPTATPVPPTTTAIPPTATPTPTPWPTPAGVTFDFDDKVPALDKSLIQDGIAIGQHAFGAAGPIIVYGHTNLDSLMDAFYRHEKVSAQDPTAISIRRLFENGPSNGVSMVSGVIYFYISDRWLRQPQAERMRGAAHEYFHQVQYALSKRSWQGIQSPTWLLEGSANYVTFRVFADYQFQESVRVRDTTRDMVWGLYSPLSSLETSEPVRVEDSRATYNLGYLATEFLVQNYGEPSISKKYWETRATTRTWQDAFRSTFGISVEDFYKKFEEYRRANFPSYCGPSGDQTTLAMRLERQLPPGSFHASPVTYIPYVFCVTGTSVGTCTSAQKEKGFGKPIGLADAGIGYCGGNCVVLAVRPDAPTGTYTFSVEAPDGRKAEATFQHTQSMPVRPATTTTPAATSKP
jgi:hypothetical protein